MRRKNKKIKQIWKRIAITAACIAAIISVTLNFITQIETLQPVEIQYVTVSTNPGMRTSINLPDGTFVYLNSASKLVYPIPYDPKERRVCLEGEAYFEVKSDKDYPFLVSVANDKLRVKVTGTTFNLAAYPGEPEIYTTLVEGSVDVQIMDDKTKTKALNDTIKELVYSYNANNFVVAQNRIKPSEKATFNKLTHEVAIRTVITDYEYAWKDGRLIFKDTPIPETLQKMSNFYNVKFIVKDPVINTYRFTGSFYNRQLTQVLDYMKPVHNIKYTIKSAIEDDSNGARYTTIILEKS